MSVATQPVRFRVGYGSTAQLVGEYARCVTRREHRIVSRRPTAPGTRFVFELSAPEATPVEVQGEVVRVIPAEDRFVLAVEYSSTPDARGALDQLLAQIRVDPRFEVRRRYPRIPVNLIASGRAGTTFVVRDLSRGGMQLECRSLRSPIPRDTPIALVVELDGAVQSIHGRVVWSQAQLAGIAFDDLDDARRTVVDGLLRLRRPDRLRVEVAPSHAGARWSVERMLASGLIADAAVEHMTRLAGLDLVHVEREVLGARDSVRARVSLGGDVSGEIVLEASRSLCARLATVVLGEQVGPDARTLLDDALAELATAVAGFACDRLEHHDLEVEVSPPQLGPGVRRAGDTVRVLAFAGPDGAVRLSILTRPVPPA